jgi:hypothetical protein
VNGTTAHWRLRSDSAVNPGQLSLLAYVYLCQQSQSQCYSVAAVPLTLSAQAGHRYRLHAREQVSGTNQFWVWAVDEANDSVAGGTQPPR